MRIEALPILKNDTGLIMFHSFISIISIFLFFLFSNFSYFQT